MTLYQHQVEGAQWLAGRRRGYLGDRPGLGKTRTIIEALSRAYGFRDGRPLIVCPAIVRTHWHREFAALGFGQAPWTIKSYDEIVRGGLELMKTLILEEKIDAVILDEAHYLKHANSQRTKMLLGLNGYARRLPRVYAASGTPVPKNPSEFWTILSSLFPDVCVEHKLRSFREFVDRFCVSRLRFIRGEHREKFMPEVRNEEEFKVILSKVMLARTLDDVGIDVPELDWQITRLDVGDRPFADRELTGVGFDIIADIVQHKNRDDNALESIANDPHVARMRRRLGELKITPVAEMLQSQLADSDEKVVVFAHHRSVLTGIKEMLKNYGVCYIDGDTSQLRRDVEIARFREDPKARVFLGQNIACGTGTDGLQYAGARRAVLVEPDWSAYQNDQLGKRLARIGATQRCVAQMICLAGTLDEAIVSQNHKEVRLADTLGLGDK